MKAMAQNSESTSKISEKFRIRLATIEDADIIAWHRARMFQDMGDLQSHLFEVFRARSCERLHDLLVRGVYAGWLVGLQEAPDKIIAGAGVHLRWVMPHPRAYRADFADGQHGIIVNVFTEPEWRRQGLAAMLLNRIIHWAREQKLGELILHSSTEGRSLYERLGFLPTTEMRFVGNDAVSNKSPAACGIQGDAPRSSIMATRTGSAVWEGTLKEGRGTMNLGSGAFDGPYSFSSRFEEGKGTNPEELIGAAEAGCYSMALSANLEKAGHPAKRISTTATVKLEMIGGGPKITTIDLKTEADVPGIDEAKFREQAELTKKTCPVSVALSSTQINLDAKLL